MSALRELSTYRIYCPKYVGLPSYPYSGGRIILVSIPTGLWPCDVTLETSDQPVGIYIQRSSMTEDP